MFKLCAVVTSYYPDLEEIEKNILSYLHGVDKLIIWENTPKNESKIDSIAVKFNSEKIEIRTTGQNEFLAKPFNICVEWAKENSFTHFLTLDQDSRFEDGHFEKYLELIKNRNNDLIAVFAPNAVNLDASTEVLELQAAMTSGSIMPVKIFDIVGKYNEDFVIDLVDTDFCLRAADNGFKIICFTKINLIHHLGNAIKTKMGLFLNNYSAQRTYYIARNCFLLWKLYPDFYTPQQKYYFCKYKIVYRLAKIFFEKNSKKKLKAIILGVIHGLQGRTGKYEV